MPTTPTPMIVLKGNLELSADAGAVWVDVACWATQFVLAGTRETITGPATMCTGEPSRGLAAPVWAVTLGYLGQYGDGTLFEMLYEAFISPTGELAFRGTISDAVVSDTNPMYTGVMLVDELGIGAPVGEMWQATPSYDVKAGTFERLDVPPVPLTADTVDTGEADDEVPATAVA
jgi:hypothetical protein